MANFGLARLAVVSPYEPHWREARSAVGAPELLAAAKETASLAEAVRHCTLVLGTGALTHRKPEQPVVRLDELAPLVRREFDRGGNLAVVFGPEKHGLTREDLSYCHALVEIPTDPRQPSMNLGQAAAVFLYELAVRAGANSAADRTEPDPANPPRHGHVQVTSSDLDILAGLIEDVMVAARYSPKAMQTANRHDLRVMLRRLDLDAADTRRALGMFRRILWRLKRNQS